MWKCVFVLAGFLALALGSAAAAEQEGSFEPTWDSLKRHQEAPQWFRDAKFGIYFHWGVYSVPAFGSEWYPRNMHRKKRPEYKHHVKTYGDPSEFGYHDFVPRFTAEKFDADAWAELFEQAGARFAGPVAEHHDGFAMWDSEVTPWNAADMGPKKDITGLLAEAVRKRGMRLVTTFHHARNPGHYPRVEGWPTTSDAPKLRILYANLPRDEFLKIWIGKLKEVIDNYHPDLMWFDSWLHTIPEELQKEYLAYYFNKARQWGKDVVVTRKQDDLPLEVSVEDFEKGRSDRLTERAWLTDDTISRGSWCYTQNLRIKPTREVIHVLIDIVSKNGCLLLNISPKADGTIPDNQKKVLRDIGTWLDTCGEAIYETRPWVVYGEGPTKMKKGGHFVGRVDYSAKDIRFTTRGDTLYAILLGEPEGQVTIASLAADAGLAGGKVKRVFLIGHDGKLAHTQDAAGLHVTIPENLPVQHAVALKIEGLEIEGFEPDLSIHFQDGKALLGAEKATLHGPGIATERKDQGKASIGYWDDPSATVSWEVKFPKAGEYRVRGRFAALKPGAFKVQIGDAALTAKAPVTGNWGKFKTVDLGTVQVSEAGRHQVEVVPVRSQWSAINLSGLKITAAQ